MDPGEYVIDKDDDDPDVAVVLHRSETPIAEWTIAPSDGEERTVAEDNPDYDESEPAVAVAFVESGLNREWPEWAQAAPEELYEGAQEHGVKCYHFPESRLKVLDEEQVAAFTSDSTVAMDDLRARLEGAEWQTDMDNAALVVEKMSEQYHISPTGEIEGEGEMREPLENLVAQYVE